jgi:hypothetical protein
MELNYYYILLYEGQTWRQAHITLRVYTMHDGQNHQPTV